MLLALTNLNNGKVPGEDDIINKYIKSTVNQFLPIHVNLFNLIFSSGIIPARLMACRDYKTDLYK